MLDPRNQGVEGSPPAQETTMGARTVGQSRTGSGFPEPDLSHGSRLIEQPNGREDGIVGTVQGKSS